LLQKKGKLPSLLLATTLVSSSLSGCIGSSSSSSDSGSQDDDTPSLISQSEARDIVKSYLTDTQEDVDGDLPETSYGSVEFDVVGKNQSNDRVVGFSYDEGYSMDEFPVVSSNIDYVISFPEKVEREDLEEKLENLPDYFAPTVKERVSLGDYGVGTNIEGEVKVRDESYSNLDGDCRVVDRDSQDIKDEFIPSTTDDCCFFGSGHEGTPHRHPHRWCLLPQAAAQARGAVLLRHAGRHR